MPDPDHHSPPGSAQPLSGHGDELLGVSGDPGATGPIRAVPGDGAPGGAAPAEHPAGPTQSAGPTEPAFPRYAAQHTARFERGAGAASQAGLLPGEMRRPPPLPLRERLSGGGAVVVALLALVLVLLLLAGLWVARRGDVTPGQATPGAAAPVVRTDTGAALVQRATRTDADCAAHSYGRVKQFFGRTPCTSLRRALYTAGSSHGPVVVSVSTVVMGSPSDAASLRRLTDTTGTGNVSDLLREGVKVESGPRRLHNASYASKLDGATAVIVEAAATSGDDHALDQLAQAALALGG